MSIPVDQHKPEGRKWRFLRLQLSQQLPDWLFLPLPHYLRIPWEVGGGGAYLLRALVVMDGRKQLFLTQLNFPSFFPRDSNNCGWSTVELVALCTTVVCQPHQLVFFSFCFSWGHLWTDFFLFCRIQYFDAENFIIPFRAIFLLIMMDLLYSKTSCIINHNVYQKSDNA